MQLDKRILSYIFTPLALDAKFGYTAFMKYVNSVSDTELYKLQYKEMQEARQPKVYTSSDNPSFVSHSISTKSTGKNVAVLTLDGVMSVSGGLCTNGIGVLCNEMAQAANNSSIEGIVVDTHCGGGEVLAAQRFGMSIKSARKQKPVMLAGDFVGSGAFWAAAMCDEVMAYGNLSEFGSIGVVKQYNKEEIEYIKEAFEFIYAEGSEDKHSDFKNILSGNLDAVKDSMKPTRDEFVRIVKSGRPNVSNEALSGFMYQSKDAKKLGLIDIIGNDVHDAIRRVSVLAKKRNRINNAKFLRNV